MLVIRECRRKMRVLIWKNNVPQKHGGCATEYGSSQEMCDHLVLGKQLGEYIYDTNSVEFLEQSVYVVCSWFPFMTMKFREPPTLLQHHEFLPKRHPSQVQLEARNHMLGVEPSIALNCT